MVAHGGYHAGDDRRRDEMSSSLREWRRRLSETFRRPNSETDEELRFHLEMAEEDALRRGRSVREARLRAGGVAQAADAVRDQSAIGWLADFLRDAGYGLRQVRGNPLFSGIAIATLALGIGGITAVFSGLDAGLIRPPPFPDAGRPRIVLGGTREGGDAWGRPRPPRRRGGGAPQPSF